MKQILLALAVSTAVLSCNFIDGHRVRGNGKVTTQTRSVTDFKGIDVSGASEVYVTQETGYSVKVETDENLQEFLITEKNGDILEIRSRDNTNLDPSGKTKIYVSAPLFKLLHASGASNIYSQSKLSSEQPLDIQLSGASDVKLDIKAPAVDVDVSGASSIKLSGQTKDMTITGSGASDIHAFDLLAENIDVDISGASKAEVNASVKIKASGSGASDINYKGSATASTDVSGASSVKKVD